jgi:hypothetical protein
MHRLHLLLLLRLLRWFRAQRMGVWHRGMFPTSHQPLLRTYFPHHLKAPLTNPTDLPNLHPRKRHQHRRVRRRHRLHRRRPVLPRRHPEHRFKNLLHLLRHQRREHDHHDHLVS